MAEHRYTFLFTDIEGSTRLWSRSPAAMAAAVQRQEQLLRHAIGNHGGTIFKNVGDGVYAVFDDAPSAVRAAVAAQRSLSAEPWDRFEDADTIAVRIAVHSGDAEVRVGDYFGATLNRLSRTLAAGHGRQVLCTDATMAACGENWPDGIDRRDLGERTLRDVPGSGRIFQLVADGLPEHFPPLTTLDPRVHNLPRWPSVMVGRAQEQARLRAALRASGTRTVTVLGTGGVGKTRLTTEVAAQLLDEYQNGIRFVDLSPLRDDAQVVPAIVQVTGAADQLLSPKDALLEWLRGRELLLVLDNCEQVVGGVAEICSEIIQVAPGITVLATSRVPIRIRGERQLALDPLPTGNDPASNAAVKLFTERAQEVSGSFTLDAGNAGEVADICRLVDGLPLAIELAAAWVRILSPEALHRRLQEGRSMLRDGARDLPDRQRTLASTIAWSYELLEPENQRAFRRLAVFRGGIAVDAAAAVIWEAEVDDPLWALSRLDALVQANLLQVAPDPTGEPRFLMLQTIQEFAVGILRDSGEWDDAATAHAEFFSRLSADAERHYGTEGVAPWFDRLDLDFENLRAAIEYRVESPSTGEEALRMVLALGSFLDQRSTVQQFRTWLELTYQGDVTLPADLRVDALWYLGNTWFGQPAIASQFYREAIGIADSAGNEELRIRPVASLSTIAALSGDYETALSMAQSVLSYGQRMKDPRIIGLGYYRIAYASGEAGFLREALEACEQTRAYSRECGDANGEAWGWLIEGRTYRRLDSTAHSVVAIDRAYDWFSEVANDEAVGLCHLEHGLAVIDSDVHSARTSIDASVTALKDCSDAYTMISLIEASARLLILSGDPEAGTELLGSARQLRDTSGIVVAASDEDNLQQSVARAVSRLGTDKFFELHMRGLVLSPRAAVDRLLSVVV